MKRMARRALRLAPLGALVGLMWASGCSELRGGPNVLLVTLDTTRRDHLGCYSGGKLTPNLDRLAHDAVRFDMAISTSGATPVAHASILTGLNNYEHGVRVIYADSGCRLSKDVPTIAGLLSKNAWHTGAFLSSFTVSSFFGFDRGFDVFDEGLEVPPSRVMYQQSNGFWGWKVESNQRRSDVTTDRAIAWIRRTNEPFLAWVHYWDPHDAKRVPPDPFVARFLTEGMNEDEIKRGIYEADVSYMDVQFGRLIDFLKLEGLYDDTIIVVVGDHGEGLGDHGWWHHRILYQEQIQIPLIMRVPGWPTDVAVDDLVRNIDITPTILERLGIDAPAGMTGRSVSGLVDGKADPQPRVAYADAINIFDLNAGLVDQRPYDALMFCATDGTWKLIHRPLLEGKDELYNLARDPQESHNLIAEEPEQSTRLREQLDIFNGWVEKPFGEPTDDKVIERLKSLGYM